MVLPFVSNILFNANARVYNLRLLLLADVVVTVLAGMSLGAERFYVSEGWSYDLMPLVVLIAGIIILLSHEGPSFSRPGPSVPRAWPRTIRYIRNSRDGQPGPLRRIPNIDD
ncbi:hypothetical protein GGX14DRAFT_393510 [Mycena pura]|uniref:Uncharacterized protein n=1 Tax=Mycena pura TaxID=153505 RepID=A0AAD6YGN1_9AGAR|nr:hypothetical protein GGX14DRAFT_393510 [Mycena pura]